MKKIIGNWKCNMKITEVVDYFKQMDNFYYNKSNLQIGFAVPHILLFLAKSCAHNNDFQIYGQDVDFVSFGSHTASVSYEHLLDAGIKHVIIGHSEVRKYNNNSDEAIKKKIIACTSHGINVVLCIGEPIDIYEKNEVVQFLVKQIDNVCKGLNHNQMQYLTIAYEPIWAIGSNKIPSNGEIMTVINVIKQYVSLNYSCNIEVLYGGSVNETNIESLTTINVLDGFLIGTASLDPLKFMQLIRLTKWQN